MVKTVADFPDEKKKTKRAKGKVNTMADDEKDTKHAKAVLDCLKTIFKGKLSDDKLKKGK